MLYIPTAMRLRASGVSYLVTKCLWRVVYDHCLGQVTSQNAQLLDVVAVHTHAVLPEESVTNQFPSRIKEVHQSVSIDFGGCGEEDDFKDPRNCLEKLPKVRSQPYKHLQSKQKHNNSRCNAFLGNRLSAMARRRHTHPVLVRHTHPPSVRVTHPPSVKTHPPRHSHHTHLQHV